MASETQARAFELITSRQERAAAKEERVFECKTCRRLFPSFQALGGHRASHKKPRVANAGGEPTHGCMLKTHGCSVCGLEFTVGQALGGHMRRHRGKKNAAVEDAKKPLWIDLNRPPAAEDSGEEVERRQFGLTLTLALHQFVDTGTIVVDC